MKPKTETWGAWESPLSARDVASAGTRLNQPRRRGDTFWWTETRPSESGRTVLVRQRGGRREDLTPAPFSVRSRVHEYGGAAWCTQGEDTWFVNDEDQVVWRRDPDGSMTPVTKPDGRRYADLVRDADRGRLVAVCEDHSGGGSEPVNTLVAIHDDGHIETLVAGADFYSSPRLDPQGRRLCWLAWDHPRLPWDGTVLHAAELDAHGRPADPRQIAGGEDVSVFQPEWLPDGRLGFVADPDGWWNHFAWDGREVERISEMKAEAGLPQWVFGQSTWGPVAGGILAAATMDGGWDVLLAGRGIPARIDWNPGALEHLSTDGREAVMLAGAPDRATAVYAMDIPGFRPRVIAEAGPLPLEPMWISVPEPVTFPTAGGEAHALFYRPRNPLYEGPDRPPPVIVKCHGGPTGATSSAFDPKVQFWTTRGFAVVDVNYRGSTGYGREYRERLYGHWGIADVEDCVAAVAHLAGRGLVDDEAALISGGSAGGYTVLCALAFTTAFRGGASYYGIGDISAMFSTTHKFEAHYDHWLVGPLDDPQTRERMEARSPLRHASSIECPVVFLQGAKDRVVPPEQSRAMHAALKDAGIPTAYLEFPDEGHGFRRAENIQRALEAELAFYGRLLGFRPAGDLPPLAIDNATALPGEARPD